MGSSSASPGLKTVKLSAELSLVLCMNALTCSEIKESMTKAPGYPANLEILKESPRADRSPIPSEGKFL